MIGICEHWVLGTRWVYDGVHDPVVTAQLTALLRGEAVAQDQDESDTLDPTATIQGTGPVAEPDVEVVRVPRAAQAEEGAPTHLVAGWTWPDGTSARGTFATITQHCPHGTDGTTTGHAEPCRRTTATKLPGRSSTGQDAPSVTRPTSTRLGSRLGDAGSLCPVSRRTPYSTASTFTCWATYATAAAGTSGADSGNRAVTSKTSLSQQLTTLRRDQ